MLSSSQAKGTNKVGHTLYAKKAKTFMGLIQERLAHKPKSHIGVVKVKLNQH